MPKITYVEANGTRHEVEAPIGLSLMQVARDNMVPGIPADCGGSCSCATCHGYLDERFLDRVEAADETEDDMLACVSDRRRNSRLTCQVLVVPALDGLIVEVPASQG